MVLTGCAADSDEAAGQENPTPEVAEGEETPEATERRPLDTVDLPANFPEHVPLYDGPITSAHEILMGGENYYWDIHVRADDAGEAIAEVREQLLEAGFPERSWSEVGALKSGVFRSDDLRVSVQTARDIDGEMLLYTVLEEVQD